MTNGDMIARGKIFAFRLLNYYVKLIEFTHTKCDGSRADVIFFFDNFSVPRCGRSFCCLFQFFYTLASTTSICEHTRMAMGHQLHSGRAFLIYSSVHNS